MAAKKNVAVTPAFTGRNVSLSEICRQIPFTAVCVSMNSVTASPSRPQLDRQRNETAPQHRPSLRSRKLTAEKKKPSETLTERFRELAVIRFNRVYACCGMLHNADYGII